VQVASIEDVGRFFHAERVEPEIRVTRRTLAGTGEREPA
jgi:hypothetical protein